MTDFSWMYLSLISLALSDPPFFLSGTFIVGRVLNGRRRGEQGRATRCLFLSIYIFLSLPLSPFFCLFDEDDSLFDVSDLMCPSLSLSFSFSLFVISFFFAGAFVAWRVLHGRRRGEQGRAARSRAVHGPREEGCA